MPAFAAHDSRAQPRHRLLGHSDRLDVHRQQDWGAQRLLVSI